MSKIHSKGELNFQPQPVKVQLPEETKKDLINNIVKETLDIDNYILPEDTTYEVTKKLADLWDDIDAEKRDKITKAVMETGL